MQQKILPSEDGVSHINVYSQGKTELGRFLSNFTRASFTCEDGSFQSIEGYWYWLSTPVSELRRDELRAVYGYQAKALGRELRAADWGPGDQTEFRKKILAALQAKLEAYPRMLRLLESNTLPLRHYYVFRSKTTGKEVVHDEQLRCQWMLDFFNSKKV
jgi:hypothetical protein